MADCRTCKFNSYLPDITDWFSCCHPTTLAKGPRWDKGDPAMVDYRTGDVRISEISSFAHCPAHEPTPKEGTSDAD